MPLYEYECDSCHEVFEVIQKFSDEPLKAHEKCGGPVHKLISASGFRLKGSGWYATDYAKGKDKAGAADSESKPAGDSAKEGAKKEAAKNGDSAAKPKPDSGGSDSKPSTTTPSSSTTPST